MLSPSSSPQRFSSVVKRPTPINSPYRKSPGASGYGDSPFKPPSVFLGPMAVNKHHPLVKDCKKITTKNGDTEVTECITYGPNGKKWNLLTYGEMKPKMLAHALT